MMTLCDGFTQRPAMGDAADATAGMAKVVSATAILTCLKDYPLDNCLLRTAL